MSAPRFLDNETSGNIARENVLLEIEDQIELLRRFVYDERRNRNGWRDRNEAAQITGKIDDLVHALRRGRGEVPE